MQTRVGLSSGAEIEGRLADGQSLEVERLDGATAEGVRVGSDQVDRQVIRLVVGMGDGDRRLLRAEDGRRV